MFKNNNLLIVNNLLGVLGLCHEAPVDPVAVKICPKDGAVADAILTVVVADFKPVEIIDVDVNVDVFLFKTNNYHAITANVILPANPNDGGLLRFNDISGQMATTKVQLNDFLH